MARGFPERFLQPTSHVYFNNWHLQKKVVKLNEASLTLG